MVQDRIASLGIWKVNKVTEDGAETAIKAF